jgi:hypothetical protein
MVTKIAFNIKGLTTYLFRISREEKREKKFHFYRAIEEEREKSFPISVFKSIQTIRGEVFSK